MPTFDTPEPISATIELIAGYVKLDATDRADTVVEVRPTDAGKPADMKAAGQTRIEYSHGKLLVKTPKQLGLMFGKGGSVDVTIELPTGSDVQHTTMAGDFGSDGSLGEVRVKTSAGQIHIDRTGPLHLRTGAGKVTVGHAAGHTDVTTGSGEVRIQRIDGTAVIKNSNGDTTLGEVTGDLRLNAANGNISVARALATTVAKTANGSIRLHEVVRGSVELQTSIGELEVGIRTGTAAWLDVNSTFGGVHNSLDSADGPAETDETVKVRARTSYGDIIIRRS